MWRVQVPKNSHSRSITGIGTPSNQSKSPRPIAISLNVNICKENVSYARSFLPVADPNSKSGYEAMFSALSMKARCRHGRDSGTAASPEVLHQ